VVQLQGNHLTTPKEFEASFSIEVSSQPRENTTTEEGGNDLCSGPES